MGLVAFINEHFNPLEPTKQIKNDSIESNYLGIAGLVAMVTAASAYMFFKGHSFGDPRTAGLMGAAGGLLFTSYLTQKDGYAWLVGALTGAGLIYATINATIQGRFFVNVNLDFDAVMRRGYEVIGANGQ